MSEARTESVQRDETVAPVTSVGLLVAVLHPKPASKRTKARALSRVRHQWLIVPFLLVSMSEEAPVLKKKALMFFVRKARACGSITLRP